MKHNITITIDDKIYKLTDFNQFCTDCSLYDFCNTRCCPAAALGGESFVELKVEK